MNRFTLLQELIVDHGYQNFLEIGTHKGKTFLPLECKNKTAVDPNFKISIPFVLKWLFKKPENFRNRYFNMTSDAFFERKTTYLEKSGKLDLVFIDGLHTFEASLTDVLNSLKYLNPKGTIVLHDCFPPTKASATPAGSLKEAANMNISDWKGSWCGDVWKTIVYLKELYKTELDVFVINTDLGLGVIRNKSLNPAELKIDEIFYNAISSYDFDYLIRDPEETIGLKNPDYLEGNLNT